MPKIRAFNNPNPIDKCPGVLYNEKVNIMSIHIGTIGERQEFFLKLVKTKETSKGYDVISFLDKDNNEIVAYGHLPEEEGELLIENQDCVLLKASIIRHQSSRMGDPQTIINRLKFIQNFGSTTKQKSYIFNKKKKF